MHKGSFLNDTFEKAIEAGQSMAKSGGKQLKQTFSPAQMIGNAIGIAKEGGRTNAVGGAESMGNVEAKGIKESTALDFEKLQKKYQNQDKSQTDALRNRLFQLVKSGEEKVYSEKKQMEAQEKRDAAYLEQEKKRKEAEKQHQAQTTTEPQGKEKQSVLAPRKKKKGVQPSPTEIKPSTGKQ